MGRSELERLSREELIELVLRLQRPDKTSRTSSKPPASDRKERRDQSKPGGAKPGHEGHSRVLSADPDAVVDHRPERCSCCGGALHADRPVEIVSAFERIDLPAVAPVVTQHRRLAVRCPSCGARVVAAVPSAARGERVTDLAASTLAAKRRALERRLADILVAPSCCDLTRALQAKIGRARDQLLVFLDHPGTVAVTNNGCERALRPAVVQRKVTNGYRAMWAAEGEADIRTVVDTARLAGASPFGTILKTIGA